MQRIKKLSIFVCSLLFLIAGLFFVGCNKLDYSKVTLTPYVNNEITNSIELDQLEEVVIQIKMNNYNKSLNGELSVVPSYDTIKCFDYESSYQNNGVTNVLISATHGGSGYITATSIDGGVSCRINIKINEYSSSIENNNKRMYVTESSPLMPRPTDFIYSENSNMKDVDFYIYGIASSSDRDLTLNDILDTGTNDYKRQFKTVYLRKVPERDNFYLIFEDIDGKFFTLKRPDNPIDDRNLSLDKIQLDGLESVEIDDFNEYCSSRSFPAEARPVQLGENYTIIARYINNFNSEIIAQRDFYVLNDLNGDQFEYSYKYFDASEPNNTKGEEIKPEENDDYSIILVPNGDNEEGFDYKRVKLQVTLPTTSDLIKLGDIDIPKYEGLEIVNIKDTSVKEDGKTIYSFEISNLSTKTATSVLNLNFYYDKYQDVKDANVNYTLSIPIKVLYEPKGILINKNSTYDATYTFYNYYESNEYSDIGWQKFLINYKPTEAIVDCYEFKFNPNQVIMKYGDNIIARPSDENEVISLTPQEVEGGVYFRGVENDETFESQYINVTLKYTVFEQKELNASIKYDIIKGVRNIAYDDTSYSDGIYVSLNGNRELTFDNIYTDGDFDDFVCIPTDEYSKSVVEVFSNGKKVVENKNYLSLKFNAKQVNDISQPAIFNIVLDNGKSFPIKIYVVEELKNVSVIVNGNTSIVEHVYSPQINGGVEEYQPATSTLYIKNQLNDDEIILNSNSIKFISNDDVSSKAITSIIVPANRTSVFTAPYNSDLHSVEITTTAMGTDAITYTICGKSIENFKLQEKDTEIEYTIKVVSYNLVQNLNIYKVHDGRGDYKDPTSDEQNELNLSSAGNVTIYSGETSPEDKRNVTLKLNPDIDGYLFLNPEKINEGVNANIISNYDEARFDKRYIYWTTNVSTIRKEGEILDESAVMYYSEEGSNEYDISGLGLFNTDTLTFKAYSNFTYDSITLTAHIRQFDRPRSFTITIKREDYLDVETISIRNSADYQQITLSDLRPQKDIIVYIDPRNATQPNIKAIYKEPNAVVDGKNETAYLFGEKQSGIKIEKTGINSFTITLTLDQDFLNSQLAKSNNNFESTLIIGAESWFTGDVVNSIYSNRVRQITINFANGSIEAPYELEVPEDVVAIKSGYNYKIHRTIDLNLLSADDKKKIPLDEFDGTIIGYNETAYIIGIEANNPYIAEDGVYYGLFKSLSKNAVIDGVKFKGQINAKSYDDKNNLYVGLVAGKNEGSLINVGVELTADSSVEIAVGDITYYAFIGGIVGHNKGLILQDYIAYAGQSRNNNENIREVYNGRLRGQSPNILMYSDFTLSISSYSLDDTSATATPIVNVGGVTGLSERGNANKVYRRKFVKDGQEYIDADEQNVYGTFNFVEGSIIKLDADTSGNITPSDKADDLTLYGYSNYMAYLNIKINGKFQTFAGMLAGQATGDIVGYSADYTQEEIDGVRLKNYKVEKIEIDEDITYDITYRAGYGIVVGGSIVDESRIDAQLVSLDNIQYIGGVVGVLGGDVAAYTDKPNETGNALFDGVTSRVSVLGSCRVGAIAGMIFIAETFTSPALAIQATDSGKLGIYSSMVARVAANASSFDDNYFAKAIKQNDDIKVDFNYVAFGAFNETETTFVENIEGYNYIESYVNRQLLKGNSDTNISSLTNDVYLGDFIVATSLNVGLNYTYSTLGSYVYARFQEGDQQSIGLQCNSDGFSPFKYREGEREILATNIFYMYYFASSGFAYQDEDVNDVAESQDYLNEYYNTVSPNSSLYPFKAYNTEIMLSSESTNLLKIDQSGRIAAQNTGIASARISSVLNTNNSVQVYIYVVNYFNKDEEISIVYPQGSKEPIKTTLDPTQKAKININGDTTLNIYIKPSNINNKVERNDSTMQEIDNRGVLLDNGANIRLKSNDTVTSFLKVYRKTREGEDPDDNINDVDVVYVYNSDGSKCNASNELSINMVGQSIIFNHTDSTIESIEEEVYIASFEPVLKVTINNIEYFARVNASVEETDLRYLRGAQSISSENFYQTTLNTANKAKTKIKVVSSRVESSPCVEILRNGKTLWTSDKDDKIENEDEVFIVKFSNNPTIETHKNGLADYIFDTEIKFNTDSKTFKNRVGDEIYGSYIIRFAASTDISKSMEIEVILERTNVDRITIDNYSDISVAADDFTSTSNIATPGRYGLLAVSLTPQDCDFDTITIENDAINYEPGNGRAVFSLVKLVGNSGEKTFIETFISGQPTATGVRFRRNEILMAYAEGNDSNFDGMVYFRYNIGTAGVSPNGRSKFNVIVDSSNTQSSVEPITLDLQIQFHAYADLIGKNALSENTAEDAYKTYKVARGLRYELQVNDIWGFTQQDVNISVDSRYSDLISIEQEGGRWYVQVTKNTIDYTNHKFGDNNNFAYARITVNATQTSGEIPRTVTSYTDLNIYEYVVNYNNEIDKNSDIVFEMSNAYINVLIGSKQNFAIDMVDFIEYDDTIRGVAEDVAKFQDGLTKNGTWTFQMNEENVFVDKFTLTPNSENDIDYSNDFVLINGLNVTPIRTHRAQAVKLMYRFTYVGYYDSDVNGRYKTNNTVSNQAKIETTFTLNVFQSSSLENPIPIDNYEDFIAMNEGSDYILINDIVIPNTEILSPITTEISSLDGNGYKIILGGTYNFGNSTRLAIFDTIGSDTILKNITIALSSDVKFTTSATSAFTASLLAGVNNGVITNCEIARYGVIINYDSQGKISSTVEDKNNTYKFSTPIGEENRYKNVNSVIAGLVATNNGYITNSRSYANIESSYSIAGFVGTNIGTIASSYFSDGSLIAHYGDAGFVVAGFVLNNQTSAGAQQGKILTSYVSGNVTSEYIFSLSKAQLGYNPKSFIEASSYSSAGFVYSNGGIISDCYSNIPISGSGEASGFVFDNGGQIINCFSTSVLLESHSLYYAFATNNNLKDVDRLGITASNTIGIFKDCYYFGNNESDGENGYILEDENWKINENIANNPLEGVTRLNRAQFSAEDNSQFNEYFGNYAIYNTNNINHDSVWFYAEQGNVQDVYNREFNSGRLELVSANIIAYTRQKLISKEEDAQTGQIQYNYIDDNCEAIGSISNPHIVASALQLETYMKQGCTSSSENYDYYRLVKDIDYSSYQSISSLYNISFYGTIEGNGMSIENINITSANKMKYAGLFAKLGRDSSHKGVLMNFDVIPGANMIFSNTSIVGGLAGRLSYGYVFNVNIDRGDEQIAISGNNFVGGLFGKAEGNYKIFNCSSNLSVIANFMPDSASSVSYENSRRDESLFSYSGGLIGYASQRGESNIINCKTNNISVLMGERTGLAFGGIGRNVEVNNLQVEVSQNLIIRAFKYGGFVVGESYGNLNFINVIGSGNQIMPYTLVPAIPTAVGGVAGCLNDGKLNGVIMSQSFTIQNDENSTNRVQSVGGIAGEQYNKVEIRQAIVDAEIISSADTLGGVIGTSAGELTLEEVGVKANDLTIQGYIISSTIGGIIGCNKSDTTINNSYCQADLTIDCYCYGAAKMETSVGGFVGIGVENIKKMENCYFSGSTDVRLEDKRSGFDVQPENGGSEIILNENKKKKDDGTADENSNITTNSTDVAFKNVYYYGYNDKDNLTKGSLSFARTPKDADNSGSEFKLTVNLVGLSTHEYYQALHNNEPDSVNFDKRLLYGIFDYYVFNGNNLFYDILSDRYYKVNDPATWYGLSGGTYWQKGDTSSSDKFTKKDLTKAPIKDGERVIWNTSTTELSTLAFEQNISSWFD